MVLALGRRPAQRKHQLLAVLALATVIQHRRKPPESLLAELRAQRKHQLLAVLALATVIQCATVANAKTANVQLSRTYLPIKAETFSRVTGEATVKARYG